MIHTYKFNCIEQLNEKLIYVDSINLQLKKGIYSSLFSQINYKNSVIQYIQTNISTSSEGTTSGDYYMFILINSKEKQVFWSCELYPNSIIVIEPNTKYSKFSFGENISLIVYIPKEKIKQSFGYLASGVYNIENKEIINKISYLSDILFNSTIKNNNFTEHYSNLILEKILQSLKNVFSPCSDCKKCKRCLKFYKIIDFMKKEYKNEITVEEIAVHFKMTNRTLRNLFSHKIGISPKQYQKSLQMNFLKHEIIKNPTLNIIDIMKNQGISLQSFMSKEFKAYFQTTPNEFKKSYFSQ